MRHALRAALIIWMSVPALAQEPTLAVPDRVRTDGVPPIPMSVVEAVAPYGQFRQARFLAWHSSERKILIATAFGNVTQVHEVRAPGAARTQLTFHPDGVTGGAWYGGGAYLLLRRDSGGGRGTMQLVRRDASGATTTLTDGHSRNGVPVWSPRRDRIAYDSTRRDGRNRDLYVMDPLDPDSARMVAALDGAWSVSDWSADGTSLLAHEAVSSASERLWRVDLATGARKLLTPEDDGGALWSSAYFGPDGRHVLALSARAGEVTRLWRGDLATGAWTAVTGEAEAIDAFVLSPDGRRAALVVDRGAVTELRIIGLPDGRVHLAPALSPGVVSNPHWRPDGSELAFDFAGARTFRDVYSLVLDSGAVVRWTASETGGADLETLPDAEIITWRSVDGLEVPGVLYRPAPRFSGPHPVMINVHGGPEMVERPRLLGRSNYFRNELGMAIIYPNIRGSTGYGRRYEQLDDGFGREDALEDIGALLDWIAARPELDRTRVMITGSSYGGYVTLMSAIRYADRLRCAFAGFAMSDLVTFLDSTDPSRRQVRLGEYGDPADPKTRAFLKSISPLTHASKLRIPLFVAQGGRDTVVPLSEAEQLVAAVRTNGTPLWYVVYEDQGHEQFTQATNDFNIYAWVMFVRTFLLN